MTVLLIIVALAVFIAVEAIRIRMIQRSGTTETSPAVRPFSEIRLPQGLFLDQNHTWARLTNLGELKVGMDELLVQAIGGVDGVDLPHPGQKVKAGEPLAVVHRGGRDLKITSPVNGEVVVANSGVRRHGNPIEDDPYGAGWLATIWPDNLEESLKGFRVGARSINWLRSETQRFCDFMAERTAPEQVGAALADGAHPIVGAAQTLDEGAWSDFESAFAE